MKSIKCALVVLGFVFWSNSASAIPITGADTMVVDGTAWVQADLFFDLSWDDINAVCVGGVCGAGTLNGYDVEGWSWASADKVNSLFNYYIGSPQLGPGPDTFFDVPDSAWSTQFFADGWRGGLLPDNSPVLQGYLYTTNLLAKPIAGITTLDYYNTGLSAASTDLGGEGPFTGAWLFRSEAAAPTPATFYLLGLAIAGLAWTRRGIA